MAKMLYRISGQYFLKESDKQKNAVSLSQSSKEGLKDGMSVRYEMAQNGNMVPVLVQFYKNGIDCGVSYSFDCMTGSFTQFVEYDGGRVCVSMDRFTIKKHKNVADVYYKQAQDMWDIIHSKNKSK